MLPNITGLNDNAASYIDGTIFHEC